MDGSFDSCEKMYTLKEVASMLNIPHDLVLPLSRFSVETHGHLILSGYHVFMAAQLCTEENNTSTKESVLMFLAQQAFTCASGGIIAQNDLDRIQTQASLINRYWDVGADTSVLNQLVKEYELSGRGILAIAKLACSGSRLTASSVMKSLEEGQYRKKTSIMVNNELAFAFD